MSDLISSIAPPAVIAKHFYGIAAYSTAICMLYLWAYWSSFDIDILQYADLLTVVKLASLPVLIAFSSLAVGGIPGHFLTKRDINIIHSSWPEAHSLEHVYENGANCGINKPYLG